MFSRNAGKRAKTFLDMDEWWKADERSPEEKMEQAMSYLLQKEPPDMPSDCNDKEKDKGKKKSKRGRDSDPDPNDLDEKRRVDSNKNNANSENIEENSESESDDDDDDDDSRGFKSFDQLEYSLSLMKAFEPIMSRKPPRGQFILGVLKSLLSVFLMATFFIGWVYPPQGVWLKQEFCEQLPHVCMKPGTKCYGPFFKWVVCDRSIGPNIPKEFKKKTFLRFIRYVTS